MHLVKIPILRAEGGREKHSFATLRGRSEAVKKTLNRVLSPHNVDLSANVYGKDQSSLASPPQ